MADAIFQVFDGNGNNQIDTNLMTQRLLKSQTITLQKSFWGNPNAKTQVTVSGKFPTLFFADAIGATGYAHSRYRIDRITSVGTGEIKSWTFHLNISSPSLPSITSYTFRIYIFDALPQATTTFGLETYDANSRLTFSSFTPPLNVKATYNIPEYIEAFQFNCETFKQIDGLILDNTAVNSSFFRDGFYASETTTVYIDIAQEYMSFANLKYPMSELPTGVSFGLYQTGETINDFGAQEGATCFGSGVPSITLIDISNFPMPFG